MVNLLLSAPLLGLLLLLGACTGGEGTRVPEPPTTTASPSTRQTPEARTTPTATSLRGSPVPTGGRFTISNLQASWQGKGIEVGVGPARPGFTGFGVAPTGIRLSRGGESVEASALVYKGFDLREDWKLVEGRPPEPQDGRKLPAHEATWWNENVVVIVHSRTGELGRDALAAFLSMN